MDITRQLESGRLVIDIALIGKLPDALVNLLTDIKALFNTCEDEIKGLKKRILSLENDLADTEDDYQDALDQIGDLTKRLAVMAIDRDKQSVADRDSIRYMSYRAKRMHEYPQNYSSPSEFDTAFDTEYGVL